MNRERQEKTCACSAGNACYAWPKHQGFTACSITAVAFLLPGQGAGEIRSAQAREVERHPWRRQLHHLRLYGRIARRHQKAESCSPAHHGLYSYCSISLWHVSHNGFTAGSRKKRVSALAVGCTV